MGEAKRRGSFEERKAQAIERMEQERKQEAIDNLERKQRMKGRKLKPGQEALLSLIIGMVNR